MSCWFYGFALLPAAASPEITAKSAKITATLLCGRLAALTGPPCAVPPLVTQHGQPAWQQQAVNYDRLIRELHRQMPLFPARFDHCLHDPAHDLAQLQDISAAIEARLAALAGQNEWALVAEVASSEIEAMNGIPPVNPTSSDNSISPGHPTREAAPPTASANAPRTGGDFLKARLATRQRRVTLMAAARHWLEQAPVLPAGTKAPPAQIHEWHDGQRLCQRIIQVPQSAGDTLRRQWHDYAQTATAPLRARLSGPWPLYHTARQFFAGLELAQNKPMPAEVSEHTNASEIEAAA